MSGATGLSYSALEYDSGRSCAVVSLAGQAGIEDCAWFRDLLGLQAAQEGGRLVVDLSRLSSMDWWAALILLWVGRVVRRRGGALILASPQPAVARMLNAAGARQVVQVYESVQQASAEC
jgi:anti-anti-sigma factor